MCREYAKGGILLVSDEEIKSAFKLLCEKGLKVELSASAVLAALIFNKVPNLNTNNKLKVLLLITGSNISGEEMAKIINE
jgi:threonine dehydratase